MTTLTTRGPMPGALLGLVLLTVACNSSGLSGSGKKAAPQTAKPAPAEETKPAKPTVSETTPEAEAEAGTKPETQETLPPDVPSNAVSQGSFTVWSEPAIPLAMQDYQIIVLVKLPPGTKNYEKSDISGTIVGTDDYEQSLATGVKWSDNGEEPDQVVPTTFTVSGGQAKLSVWTPGASEVSTEDTITVKSTLLNETQAIKVNYVK